MSQGQALMGVFMPPEQMKHELDALTGRFAASYRKAVVSAFESGQVLMEGKSLLDHGQWESWVRERLPVSPRTARKLMRIASDPNLLRAYTDKSDSESVLPASWTTLYELTGQDEEHFDALVEAGKIHPDMTRADVKVAFAERSTDPSPPALPPPPEGKYRAILADPPWRFATRGEGARAAAERHYPTMALADVELLPVMELAAEDAVLFLWVTSERLADAPRVMVQWGFELVSTAFVWVKDGQPGLGYWTRKGAELCLLGTRGSPRRVAADVPEVVHAPRGRHSEKPAEVHGRIERLVNGPYIELFARQTRPGWDAWGNDPALGGATADAE